MDGAGDRENREGGRMYDFVVFFDIDVAPERDLHFLHHLDRLNRHTRPTMCSGGGDGTAPLQRERLGRNAQRGAEV